MYAIIQTGGKQYRVQAGDRLHVEKLEEPVDSQISLQPLLVSDGVTTQIGSPVLQNAQVIAKVGSPFQGEKLRIFKMKRRKGYRRKTGHRQPYTTLHILEIKATA